MSEKERNDYFYVCALIEYIARETRNHRGDIVQAIGKQGVEKLLRDAEVYWIKASGKSIVKNYD